MDPFSLGVLQVAAHGAGGSAVAKAVATARAAAAVAAPTCALWLPAFVAVVSALGLAAISSELLEIVQSPQGREKN